jgi:hypothetical protein
MAEMRNLRKQRNLFGLFPRAQEQFGGFKNTHLSGVGRCSGSALSACSAVGERLPHFRAQDEA